ncbi:MAG: hypothetical protein CFK52_09380 [Chloracidobacterium sp. CP2_5A]|nr:MAG: hypothetical protein CFK52_09380 [Chloracidobacterium sp. CP2_5A]
MAEAGAAAMRSSAPSGQPSRWRPINALRALARLRRGEASRAGGFAALLCKSYMVSRERASRCLGRNRPLRGRSRLTLRDRLSAPRRGKLAQSAKSRPTGR